MPGALIDATTHGLISSQNNASNYVLFLLSIICELPKVTSNCALPVEVAFLLDLVENPTFSTLHSFPLFFFKRGTWVLC